MAADAMVSRWAELELLPRALLPHPLLYAALWSPAMPLHTTLSLALLLLSLTATPAMDAGGELNATHASRPLCASSTLATTATAFTTACSTSRACLP